MAIANTPNDRANTSTVTFAKLSSCQRPVFGALHLCVDTPVQQVINRGRRGGGQTDAKCAGQQGTEWWPPGHCQKHTHNSGKNNQYHHFWFTQLQVLVKNLGHGS